MATLIQNKFFVIPNHFVKFVKKKTLKDTGPKLSCLIHKDMQFYRIFENTKFIDDTDLRTEVNNTQPAAFQKIK